MKEPIKSNLEKGTAHCHTCMTNNGYVRKTQGAVTGTKGICSGCGENKVLLSTRHWK